MSRTSVGRLARVDLREVWVHEAKDFTQWLQKNIDVLNEALDLNLSNVNREQAGGSFNVDLVAEDTDRGIVIIENQLEKSNHDHLGKLITYLTAVDAQAAIWIVSDPRPEHVAAIAWLNESGSAAFYMVKVEAVCIGDSPAAALFTLIVGPSQETRDAGQAKKKIAESRIILKEWWTTLIERSAKMNRLHAHITPSDYTWISASAGARGLNLNYVVTQDERAAELYIDRGKNSDDENKSIFEKLLAHRADIETAFGEALSWEWQEGRRACRIRHTQTGGGYRSPKEKWPFFQDVIIKDMDRLDKAIRLHLQQLKLGT